jgi:uncharacterized protein RhaS with RHS repeats
VPNSLQASYNRARYYDPVAGRFLSEDPSDYNSEDNFYEYVESNPTSSIDPFGLQQQGNANQLTYGEMGGQAITSLRDFSAPRGLADAKASINGACHRGNSCSPGDGSRATAPGDRAAWANILNSNGGTDHSGGGNLVCVFTQNCIQVHRCTVCRNGQPVQIERPNPLPPVGTVVVGDPPNARTLYFYNDPLQGWGNAADRRSGCLPPRHPRRRRTH